MDLSKNTKLHYASTADLNAVGNVQNVVQPMEIPSEEDVVEDLIVDQLPVESLSYTLDSLFNETQSHSKGICGVAFNTVIVKWMREDGLLTQDLFATCGDKVCTLYSHNANTDKFKHAYTFRDDDDVFHCCAITWSQETQHHLLIVAGLLGRIRVIDIVTHQIQTYVGHTDAVNDLKVPLWRYCKEFPKLVLSASYDCSIRLWNTKNGVPVAKFGGAESHLAGVMSVDFHPSGPYFASCGLDQSVRVWSLLRTGLLEAIFASDEIEPNDQKKFQFKTQIEHVPVFVTQSIHDHCFDSVAWINDLLISKSCTEYISVFRPGRIVLNKLPPLYEMERIHVDNTACLFMRFGMDYRRQFLAQGDLEGNILLLDLRQNRINRDPIKIPAHPETRGLIVRQVAFNFDGNKMVAVTDKCRVMVFNLAPVEKVDFRIVAKPCASTSVEPATDSDVGEVQVMGTKDRREFWLSRVDPNMLDLPLVAVAVTRYRDVAYEEFQLIQSGSISAMPTKEDNPQKSTLGEASRSNSKTVPNGGRSVGAIVPIGSANSAFKPYSIPQSIYKPGTSSNAYPGAQKRKFTSLNTSASPSGTISRPVVRPVTKSPNSSVKHSLGSAENPIDLDFDNDPIPTMPTSNMSSNNSGSLGSALNPKKVSNVAQQSKQIRVNRSGISILQRSIQPGLGNSCPSRTTTPVVAARQIVPSSTKLPQSNPTQTSSNTGVYHGH